MKNRILKNWNFLRIFRLVMGLLISIQAIMASEMLFAGLGVLLTGTAIFNVGCCGTGGCEVSPRKVNHSDEPEYEEVK